jgi:hypothetical protein
MLAQQGGWIVTLRTDCVEDGLEEIGPDRCMRERGVRGRLHILESPAVCWSGPVRGPESRGDVAVGVSYQQSGANSNDKNRRASEHGA